MTRQIFGYGEDALTYWALFDTVEIVLKDTETEPPVGRSFVREVKTKKPRSFRGFLWSVLRHSLQYPLGGLNSRKILRENRRLLFKATHNQTHLASFPIRDSLG